MSQANKAKELNKVSDYAAKKESEMEELATEFTHMRYLWLLWDSKVPDKDKKFNYFFCLSASHRDYVLNEIKKYQDFYKELGDAVHKVSNSEEQTDNEKMNPYLIIHELNEKLEKMAEAAKFGKSATASSALHDLHGSFIEKLEELENMIKRVECVALKELLKNATDGYQAPIHALSTLQNDLEGSDELETLERLVQKYEGLLEQKEMLIEMNKEIEEQMVQGSF